MAANTPLSSSLPLLCPLCRLALCCSHCSSACHSCKMFLVQVLPPALSNPQSHSPGSSGDTQMGMDGGRDSSSGSVQPNSRVTSCQSSRSPPRTRFDWAVGTLRGFSLADLHSAASPPLPPPHATSIQGQQQWRQWLEQQLHAGQNTERQHQCSPAWACGAAVHAGDIPGCCPHPCPFSVIRHT